VSRLLAWFRADTHRAAVVALGLGALFCASGVLRRCAPAAPAVVETRHAATAEVRQVETAQVEARRAEVRHVVTRTERRPDGGETVTVEETERSDAAAVSVTAGSLAARAEERTEVVTVTAPRPSWRVGVTAGWEIAAPQARPSVYGLDVSRRVAGPVWLGAWARTDRTAGVTVAAEW
jgi:hypothetical protein